MLKKESHASFRSKKEIRALAKKKKKKLMQVAIKPMQFGWKSHFTTQELKFSPFPCYFISCTEGKYLILQLGNLSKMETKHNSIIIFLRNLFSLLKLPRSKQGPSFCVLLAISLFLFACRLERSRLTCQLTYPM